MTASDRPTKKTKTAGSPIALAEAIVAGRTITAAAKAANMSEATARRRLKDADVIELLTELRTAQLTAAADRLASIAAGAAAELGRIITNQSTAPGVKVRAIAIALHEAMRLRGDIITEGRLAAIEQHLEAEKIAKEAQQQRLRLAYGGAR